MVDKRIKPVSFLPSTRRVQHEETWTPYHNDKLSRVDDNNIIRHDVVGMTLERYTGEKRDGRPVIETKRIETHKWPSYIDPKNVVEIAENHFDMRTRPSMEHSVDIVTINGRSLTIASKRKF